VAVHKRVQQSGGRGLSSADIFRTRIFRNFVWTSFMDGPYPKIAALQFFTIQLFMCQQSTRIQCCSITHRTRDRRIRIHAQSGTSSCTHACLKIILANRVCMLRPRKLNNRKNYISFHFILSVTGIYCLVIRLQNFSIKL